MNPIVRNIISVVLGFFAGSIVHMGTLMIGGEIITPPAGVDVSDMEGLKTGMYLRDIFRKLLTIFFNFPERKKKVVSLRLKIKIFYFITSIFLVSIIAPSKNKV